MYENINKAGLKIISELKDHSSQTLAILDCWKVKIAEKHVNQLCNLKFVLMLLTFCLLIVIGFCDNLKNQFLTMYYWEITKFIIVYPAVKHSIALCITNV